MNALRRKEKALEMLLNGDWIYTGLATNTRFHRWRCRRCRGYALTQSALIRPLHKWCDVPWGHRTNYF